MHRKAITTEMKRRGWNAYHLSKESGVHYSRLHVWLKDPDARLNTDNAEKLMQALGLRICRGKQR